MEHNEIDERMTDYFDNVRTGAKAIGCKVTEEAAQWAYDVYMENQDLKQTITDRDAEIEELREQLAEVDRQNYLGRGAY